MTAVDPFEHDDAAYVLGLLDPRQRAAFETHLAACAECSARVAALSDTTVMLAELDITDADVVAAFPDVVPDTSLPQLLRAAGLARRRQRRLTTGLAVAAAACLAAFIVAVWPAGDSPSGQAHRLNAVATTPLAAVATLTSHRSGTTISLKCHYAGWASDGASTYRLTAIDDEGVPHRLGSWTVAHGDTTFSSTIDLPSSRLRTITVADGAGHAVLTADV